MAAAVLLVACTAPPGGDGPPVVGPSAGATPPASLRLATSFASSLDPRDLDSADALQLASQVFDGLVGYDPVTLETLPAAAERWDIDEGGARFVFHLRPGMTFHDGAPVRAQDFVFAWNRLADPLAANPYSFLLERVEGFGRYQEQIRVTRLSGVVARNDLTLEVTLVRPWRDFVALLGHPSLSPVPPAAGGETFGTQPVGNGPYRLAAALSPGSPLVLQRFDAYYGIPPAVPTLEYRTFEVPSEAWPEFLAGELDLAPIPPALLAVAESSFGDRGVTELTRLLYCGFNEEDPRFEDADLRRAASLAVGRDVIAADIYGGAAVPATGVVPPSLPSYRPDLCVGRCTHDPEGAGSLVEGILRRNRTFSLDYPSSPVADQLAGTLVAQLEEVGLTVTPRPHDQVGFRDLLDRGLHEMFCLVWVADYPRPQAMLEPLLDSGSADNHARVSDRDLDTLLERGRTEPSPEIRTEIYAEVERLALERMHVLPVVWFRSHLAAHPGVEGFVVDPLGRYDAAALRFAA
ncbi:MAG: ABC transporter substrate-binding protein [Actinomycetota bacterium]